jgi:hypothetical protein
MGLIPVQPPLIGSWLLKYISDKLKTVDSWTFFEGEYL